MKEKWNALKGKIDALIYLRLIEVNIVSDIVLLLNANGKCSFSEASLNLNVLKLFVAMSGFLSH